MKYAMTMLCSLDLEFKGEKMKFLVVDDSKLSRTKLVNMILDLGYEVLGEAVDGLDAVDKFELLSPSYITMDLEMPKLNGIGAAEKILTLNPNVNILLITSIVDKKETLQATHIGIKSILQKPITQAMLSSALEDIERKRS